MKALANVLAVLGLLAVLYWTSVQIRARLYQSQETERFAAEQNPPINNPTRDRPRPIVGSAIGILEIPRVKLSAVVIEGAGEGELRLGPGHIPGTSLPGDGGNVGVAGHRDTFFRPLRRIQTNDTIKLSVHAREYRYNVVSTEVVGPNDVRVLYPTGHETLTLVTCYPFDYVGAAPTRFIVHADCVDCPIEATKGKSKNE
jgi:sortase A